MTSEHHQHVELRRGCSVIDIRLRRGVLVQRYGRLGHALSERIDELPTEPASPPAVHFQRRVHHLMRKGYLLASHAENETLVQQIAADPERAELYEVYADWLEEAGDPRAPVIRAGIQATLTKRKADAEEFERLAHDQPLSFIRPLWSYRNAFRSGYTWRYGFLASMKTFESGSYPDGAGFEAVEPSSPWDTRMHYLRSILRHPAGRFFRQLDVRSTHSKFFNKSRFYDVRLNGKTPELRLQQRSRR